MNLNIHTGLAARFKLQVRKVGTSEIKLESAWSDNIVLDAGLARMSVGEWFNRCCVGAGSSIPSVSQVALDNFIASTTTKKTTATFVETAIEPYHYGARITWRFGAGIATGNISEVGIGWANNALWDRALVKDTNGSPATITVLSDEYLDVVSEIRVYPKKSISGSFQLLNKTGAVIGTHNFVGIPSISDASADSVAISFARLTIRNGAIGSSVGAIPSGVTLGVISDQSLVKSYPTPTSFKAVCTVGLNVGIGVHKSLLVEMYGPLLWVQPAYQFEINPPISKTNLQEMTYTITGSWGRYNAA